MEFGPKRESLSVTPPRRVKPRQDGNDSCLNFLAAAIRNNDKRMGELQHRLAVLEDTRVIAMEQRMSAFEDRMMRDRQDFLAEFGKAFQLVVGELDFLRAAEAADKFVLKADFGDRMSLIDKQTDITEGMRKQMEMCSARLRDLEQETRSLWEVIENCGIGEDLGPDFEDLAGEVSLQVGDVVRLVNLTKADENGKTSTLVEFMGKKERWQVNVGGKPLLVKETN